MHIILQTWSKLSQSGGGSWPEERSDHAACCLNYGQQYPQLLVTGGRDRQNKPLSDAWVLDIERGQWRKVCLEHSTNLTMYVDNYVQVYTRAILLQVNGIQRPRWGHSITAFSLGPGLTEVMEFGGSSEPTTGSNDTQPKLVDTTLLQFSE